MGSLQLLSCCTTTTTTAATAIAPPTFMHTVVRYHKGEFYHEHYDNRADGPLTRAATILVYLCDTQEGGATRCVCVCV